MTPDEHYYQAERLLAQAEAERNGTVEERLVARAQVHATLATRQPPPRPAPAQSGLADHLRRTAR